MKNDRLIARLVEQIPPLPEVAHRVLYLARQNPVDFQELEQVIETDPTLSAFVLRLANSPLYGPVRHRVESLSRAIVILGQNHIIDSLTIYITRCLRSISKTTSWPNGDLNFWKHSIGVAVTSRILAQRMRVNHAQQCFLAGLLHDMGKLALLAYDPTGYSEVLNNARLSNRPLYYVELEKFGVTHSQIGGLICKKWYMPITCAKAVSYHHDDPDFITVTVSNIVRSADLMVKVAGIGDSGNPFGINSKKLLLPHPQFTENDIFSMLDDLSDTVEQLTSTVMGHAAQPANTQKTTRLKPMILVHTAEQSQRLLIRYTLHAMEYPHDNYLGRGVQLSSHPPIKILDYLPAIVNPDQPVIDFKSWLDRQISTPHNELNILSLRNWLESEIHRVTTTVHY